MGILRHVEASMLCLFSQLGAYTRLLDVYTSYVLLLGMRTGFVLASAVPCCVSMCCVVLCCAVLCSIVILVVVVVDRYCMRTIETMLSCVVKS